jgi:uncharacterized membrane protein HdeD (DUF308 family)
MEDHRSQEQDMGTIETFHVAIPQDIAQQWGWFLAFGIVLVALGFMAVARSFSATIATMMFFGWLLLLAGAIEIAQAIMVGQWAGFFHHLVAAVLFGVVGFLLVAKPVISAETLTLFMAMFFLVGGLFRFAAALFVHVPGWEWQAVDGVITFVLGALVLAQWPVSGLWAIGLFIGVDLVFYGASWIALALRSRSM